MLRFEHLTKSYGGRRILTSMQGAFAPGVHALRGPNGIGKSTLLRVLAGIVEPDGGSVWIGTTAMHADPVGARTHLGYVPDECPVYPFMTGRELLAFVAYAKRCPLAPDVLALAERFGLGPHLDSRCGAMSLGTQKKLMLVAAWIGAPAVLLLDEPSNGLDADARALLLDLLRDLRQSAVILMSTHDLAFANTLDANIVEFDALRDPRLAAATD